MDKDPALSPSLARWFRDSPLSAECVSMTGEFDTAGDVHLPVAANVALQQAAASAMGDVTAV